MQDKIYEIIILCPTESVDYVADPKCYAENYEKAVEIARPLVEQGHDVAFCTVTRED